MLEGKFQEAREKASDFQRFNNIPKENAPRVKEGGKDRIRQTTSCQTYERRISWDEIKLKILQISL